MLRLILSTDLHPVKISKKGAVELIKKRRCGREDLQRPEENFQKVNLHQLNSIVTRGRDLTKTPCLTSIFIRSMLRRSRRRCLKDGNYDEKSSGFWLGDTEDYWSYKDGFLVRNHVLGKTSTFKAQQSPVDVADLQNVNGLTMAQGQRKIYVNDEQHDWRAALVW